MSDPAKRARVHFPTIQITMVSIIVALALQQWLDRLPNVAAMWEPSLVAARIWCQALTAFVIIVKMWSGFVLASVVTERVPSALDLLGPIGILIFVDAQIASIGVEHVLRWWYVLGAGSLLAAAFIAGQMIDNPDRTAPEAEFIAGRSRLMRRFGAANPATAEATLGIVALLIAALHQAIGLDETGLLVACSLYLIAEAVSAIGPIVAWRVLRRLGERN
jgi:hypothetical protein